MIKLFVEIAIFKIEKKVLHGFSNSVWRNLIYSLDSIMKKEIEKFFEWPVQNKNSLRI